MRILLKLMIGAAISITALSQSAVAAGTATLSPEQEGRRLYLKLNCYGCHGMHGTGGMGPRLIGEDDDDEEIQKVVLNGADEGMPSFRNTVSATDIANLAAYLRTLGTPSEPTFLHWWEPVPSE